MISIADDITKFQALPASKKLMVISIVTFVFIASIILGSIAAKNYLSSTDNMLSTPAEAEQKTNLSISPTSQTATVGATITFDVALDTMPVTVADIELTYDPALIKIESITNGTVFPSLFKQEILERTVLISGSVDLNDRDTVRTGVVATVTAKAVAPGNATISFGSEFTSTAKNGEKTLGSTTGATVTIN